MPQLQPKCYVPCGLDGGCGALLCTRGGGGCRTSSNEEWQSGPGETLGAVDRSIYLAGLPRHHLLGMLNQQPAGGER